jgi:hypothetical protein
VVYLSLVSSPRASCGLVSYDLFWSRLISYLILSLSSGLVGSHLVWLSVVTSPLARCGLSSFTLFSPLVLSDLVSSGVIWSRLLWSGLVLYSLNWFPLLLPGLLSFSNLDVGSVDRIHRLDNIHRWVTRDVWCYCCVASTSRGHKHPRLADATVACYRREYDVVSFRKVDWWWTASLEHRTIAAWLHRTNQPTYQKVN